MSIDPVAEIAASCSASCASPASPGTCGCAVCQPAVAGSSRREFLGAAAGVGLGAAGTLLTPGSALAAAAGKKRRYAIVGTGIRATTMWGRDLKQHWNDAVEFVGLCDINRDRAISAAKLIGVDCPVFTDFDEMCDKTKPELLAVMTLDAEHATYIVKALERGIDVMTEKPMVIDEKQCQAVLDAEKRTGRKTTVTFNYRYAPRHQRIKEILMSGELGKVLHVNFDWFLNTTHGADYFRRWHRLQAKSGSLFVHKSTHHFDLVNWWLDADPVEVMAYGQTGHYGKAGPFRHSHCRPCPHKAKCPHVFDVTKNKTFVQLYVDNEKTDGYLRDGCVYKEDIDTYDSMSALVKYSNGVSMAYSLNAFMPYEGYDITFTCDKGTLQGRLVEKEPGGDRMEIILRKSFNKNPPVVERPKAEEGHGGGDDRLRDAIFRPEKTKLPAHLKLPGSRAGAMSCMTGVAARKSVQSGRPVKISELVKLG